MSQMLDIDNVSVDVTEVRAINTRIVGALGHTEVRVEIFFKNVEDALTVNIPFGSDPDAAAEWCDIIKGDLSRKKESVSLRG